MNQKQYRVLELNNSIIKEINKFQNMTRTRFLEDGTGEKYCRLNDLHNKIDILYEPEEQYEIYKLICEDNAKQQTER